MIKKLQITLYKNWDDKQPIQFRGILASTIETKIKRWMTDNNGEWSDRAGQKPCRVDGLHFPDGNKKVIGLVWDDFDKEWIISIGSDNEHTYTEWDDACNHFVELITHYAVWKRV